MQELIIEILIGIVILTLLSMVVIPLYNQVVLTINGVLYRNASNEVENSLFVLEGEIDYMGSEVISQIEYFSCYANRKVTVINAAQTMSYIDSAYNGEEFWINLYDRYSFQKNNTPNYVEYIYTLKN